MIQSMLLAFAMSQEPGPGILVVTPGPCCCWYSPVANYWMPCENCLGWQFAVDPALVDVQPGDCLAGPGQPLSVEFMHCGGLDKDCDGDVDLADVAMAQETWPWPYEWVYWEPR